MTETPGSAVSGEDWLYAYLADAVRKNLCTKIHCTTCGAREFRLGLLAALTEATGQHFVLGFDRRAALAIAAALARLPIITEHESRFEAAIRLILFEIWYTIGEMAAESELEPVLEGTWGGRILARMKAHHKAREAANRAQEEYNDPIRVQQRREEKRRLRQEKHAERLELKKERDRLWRERQGKDQ